MVTVAPASVGSNATRISHLSQLSSSPFLLCFYHPTHPCLLFHPDRRSSSLDRALPAPGAQGWMCQGYRETEGGRYHPIKPSRYRCICVYLYIYIYIHGRVCLRLHDQYGGHRHWNEDPSTTDIVHWTLVYVQDSLFPFSLQFFSFYLYSIFFQLWKIF